MIWWIILILVVLVLLGVLIHDVFQKKDSILRNYPLIGRGRDVLNNLGPKLRQYIVAGNDAERPFTRDQRSWVYRSAVKVNNYFGFGTDNDIEQTASYLIIKQSTFPLSDPLPGDPNYDEKYAIPVAKILGEHRERKQAFRPSSIINTSAMSYGSISAAAVEAMNKGCKLAGCLQNTGEGGIAPHHDHGGELVWQIGTGYFGARNHSGGFDPTLFTRNCHRFPVRAIELKISQGAKPGRGGVLPGTKVTAEIASIRGIQIGRTCISPSAHIEFSNADEMLDFVEKLSELSGGLPVGIKSAVGEMEFWRELAQLMTSGTRGVDFISIDGGEGGTGAAPLVFADHVSLPFKMAMSRVFREFAQIGLHEKITFIGSGKLGFPHESLLAMALGCDAINVGREAMLAVGCIQAQECHTGHCPTGVATQDKWLMRGLDPTDKSVKLANYIINLRKEILELCRACGFSHPAQITTDQFELLEETYHSRSIKECLKLQGISTTPCEQDVVQVVQLMADPKPKS